MSKIHNKVLWIDTETTGIDKNVNGLIQLAALMEINGQIVDEFEVKIKPFKGQICEGAALQVTGFTMARLRSEEFIEPQSAHHDFKKFLTKHINKFDKHDKAYIGGQNVSFDIDFVNKFFENNNDPYLGSYVNWRRLDSLNLAHFAAFIGLIDVKDFKLETLAKLFSIELDAHDALSDIKVSKEIFYKLKGRLLSCPECGRVITQCSSCIHQNIEMGML